MKHLTPKAVLSVRAMQHLLAQGWPNHGLHKTKRHEFESIQQAFESETGTHMTARDLQYQGELPNDR